MEALVLCFEYMVTKNKSIKVVSDLDLSSKRYLFNLKTLVYEKNWLREENLSREPNKLFYGD